MKENLDKWIKDAKEATPDSGEYRRLNRVLLKEHMQATNPGLHRHHRFLILTVTMVLLLMFSGQVSQLGSDGFDTRKSVELSAMGDTVARYFNEFRGSSISLPDDFTEADVDEFQRSVAAGDGTIFKVTGLSYGGKTTWVKHETRTVNGREQRSGVNPDSPSSSEPDNYMSFLKANYQDLLTRSQTDPPQDQLKMMVDGVLIEFGIWKYDYAGYGEVTRYVGYPVSKN